MATTPHRPAPTMPPPYATGLGTGPGTSPAGPGTGSNRTVAGPGGFPLISIDGSSIATLGLGLIKKFREERLSSLRPLPEFFNTTRMSKPNGLASVASRLSCNLSYFRGNYTLVFLGITAYSLVSNAMLMFSVGFVVGGTHLISKVPPEGLMLGENRYNKSQLQTGMACIAVPLFFFSSTIGTIFYIVGASAVTILGHAAFMEEHIEGDFADTVV